MQRTARAQENKHKSLLAARAVVALAVALCACGGSSAHDAGMDGSDAGECGASPSLDCQVAFDPTYAAIFDNVLLKTCGSPSTGASCHGPSGKQDGLVLADKDTAYDYLLGMTGDARQVVVPGKPACSVLERRLESSDPNFRMPLGQAALSAGARCAIRKWIAAGAPKE